MRTKIKVTHMSDLPMNPPVYYETDLVNVENTIRHWYAGDTVFRDPMERILTWPILSQSQSSRQTLWLLSNDLEVGMNINGTKIVANYTAEWMRDNIYMLSAEKMEELLHLDTLQIELGYGLLALADPKKGGDLLERVTGVRRTFVQDMGFIIPAVRLRDNLELQPNEYRFIFRGQLISTGEVMPGYWLAMNTNNSTEVLPGVQTTEPVFGLPATWITDVERKNAELAGYTVVDSASVMVTHFGETIKRSCSQILSRQDVQVLLDNLKDQNPALVNELVPNLLTVGQVQRILQNLLAEGVSIRNLVGILERVADYADSTKNPDELSEHARKAIGAQVVKAFLDEHGRLPVMRPP